MKINLHFVYNWNSNTKVYECQIDTATEYRCTHRKVQKPNQMAINHMKLLSLCVFVFAGSVFNRINLIHFVVHDLYDFMRFNYSAPPPIALHTIRSANACLCLCVCTWLWRARAFVRFRGAKILIEIFR